MKPAIIGLWVIVMLILLPKVLSLDVETDKLSYHVGETIKVHVSKKARVEYNDKVKYGRYVKFKAVELENKIIVNNEYEKLIYVSDGKTTGTLLNLGIFGGINVFIFKIIKKCWKKFI